MEQLSLHQWIIKKTSDDLDTWLDAFLVDRKAQNQSKTTLYFYQKKVQRFKRFSKQENVHAIAEVAMPSLDDPGLAQMPASDGNDATGKVG